MSLVLTKSPKHCAERGILVKLKHIRKHKKFLYTTITTLLSIIFFLLLLYLTLHPTKPSFTLREADIYHLNLSSSSSHAPQLLTTSIQVTFESHNPNQKVGIYYDELQTYVSYRGQQITVPARIPPFYQGSLDSDVLNAELGGGDGLPVAMEVGDGVGRDRVNGRMVLTVRVDGMLRWKIGSWVSGRYRVMVNCVVAVSVDPNYGQQAVATAPVMSRLQQGNIDETGSGEARGAVYATQQGSQCSTSI